MITLEEIIRDLRILQNKFGTNFLLLLCASMIFTHQWYNWREMRYELIHMDEPGEEGK